MPSEQVANIRRNEWTLCSGITGRHGQDYAVVCESMLNLPAKSGATMLLFLSFNREPAQPALNNIRQQERGSREAIATGSQLDQRRFHLSRLVAGASSTCQPILVALGALSSRSDSRF